jgi:hypothetical protein
MTIDLGEEFKVKATPSPELQRKLAYLAAQDNDSVLTGGFKASTAGHRGSDSDKARKRADALMLARLADPEYQAVSQRINNNLDLMDEASVHALQEIEQELLELRRERERMLAQAYRDEDGNAIFIAEDESAAFYEDGEQVDDEKFARIKDELRGRTTWDGLQRSHREEDDLVADRDRVHAFQAESQSKGDKLREDLAQGAISQDEAEQREREIEDSLPERARRSLDALRGHSAATPDGEPADPQPAEAHRTSGAAPFQPG